MHSVAMVAVKRRKIDFLTRSATAQQCTWAAEESHVEATAQLSTSARCRVNDDWIEEADADHVSEDENSSKIATSVFLCYVYRSTLEENTGPDMLPQCTMEENTGPVMLS